MEIQVQAAILHVLDTAADEPLLADVPLAADEETARYLAGHLQRAFGSEEARDCSFRDDSPLPPFTHRSRGTGGPGRRRISWAPPGRSRRSGSV